MTLCKDCIVDMICIQKCPMFKVDLDRLHSDNFLYLKRCMNNIENGTSYEISRNIGVNINKYRIIWYKNGTMHRDNDKPTKIYSCGSKYWYRDGNCYRREEVKYEPM